MYRRWRRLRPVYFRWAMRRNCDRCSKLQPFGTWKSPQKFIVFRCLPSTLTSNPLSKARGRPDRHLSRYPRMRVMLFVKKCGATSTTRVGQSRLRSNTGSEAGDDNRYERHPNNSRMSALGRSRHWQKLTCAPHSLMSALGQKRTFVTDAICQLFDHLIGGVEQAQWNGKPKRFGCLEIDDKFEP